MYKLTQFDTVIRSADGARIPADQRNRDYAEYLEWLEAGNAPEPADPVIEPEPITEMVYDHAIVATDFRVQSPEIPKDRKKAMQDAVKESKKISKSVPFIAMANTHVLEGLLARVEDLEKQLKKMSI